MKLLISNYLAAIGGLSHIKNLRSHSLWCSITAKGIHQQWKESYNYESGEFQIVTENDGAPFMTTEGNRAEAVRRTNQESQKISVEELATIHSTIMLVPEVLFLEEAYINSIADISLEIIGEEKILKFSRSPYLYTYIFNVADGLKKEIHLSDMSDSNIALTIKYKDWRYVDGLLYPFVQEMVSVHQESVRRVEYLKIDTII